MMSARRGRIGGGVVAWVVAAASMSRADPCPGGVHGYLEVGAGVGLVRTSGSNGTSAKAGLAGHGGMGLAYRWCGDGGDLDYVLHLGAALSFMASDAAVGVEASMDVGTTGSWSPGLRVAVGLGDGHSSGGLTLFTVAPRASRGPLVLELDLSYGDFSKYGSFTGTDFGVIGAVGVKADGMTAKHFAMASGGVLVGLGVLFLAAFAMPRG